MSVGASAALRAAALEALRCIAGVNGVRDVAEVHATRPYLVLGDVAAVDWGTKDRTGRELRLTVTVREGGPEPARVRALADAVDAAVAGLPRVLDGGWQVASVVLMRSAVVAERGPGADRGWAAMVDHRVRVLAGA